MFGNLFKKIKKTTDELVDAVQESVQESQETNPSKVENEQESSNDLPEIRYYIVDTYSDVEDYLEIVVAIESQMLSNENQFDYASEKKNSGLMKSAISNWLHDIEKYKSQIQQLGSFDGNDYMVKKTLESFNDKKIWVENYFTLYSEAIESNAPNLSNIEKKMEEERSKLYNSFNDSFNHFRQIFKHKVEDQLIDINFIENDIEVQKNAINNPLLEPIHGISLYDYAVGCSQKGAGIAESEILKALGVEKPLWDEADLIWQQRMQEDDEMTIMTLFSQYFGKINEHPKLGNLSSVQNTSSSNEHLERIKTDEHYFYELTGAREAAFESGLDGGQWILENYGIEITEFQTIAMNWMRSGNMMTMLTYQAEKKQEYLDKIQKELGGTIADDIEF